ncbi:MAG: hypothetical protein JST84_23325 [Acidobacteria bacterium]|nr:hypothetical protein [Acidobacteriota bacterium]
MVRRVSIFVIILIGGILAAGSAITNADCTLKNLPNLNYGTTTCRLNDDAKAHLAKVAQLWREHNKTNAPCNIAIVGNPAAGEESQEKVDCRLGVIKRHLMNTEGIDSKYLMVEASGKAKDENLFEFKTR